MRDFRHQWTQDWARLGLAGSDAAPGDTDACLVVDIDLAILGADAARFAE